MKKRRFRLAHFVLLALFVVAIVQSIQMSAATDTFTVVESNEVATENISSVMEANNEYIITYNDGTAVKVLPTSSIGFSQELFAKGIDIEHVENLTDAELPIVSFLRSLVIGAGITFILFIILITIGVINIGKASPTESRGGQGLDDLMKQMIPDTSIKIKKEIPKTSFDDVQGCKELKRDAEGLIQYMKNPYKYELMGARMPKGVILYGPPGTGKTLIARAVAGEANVPFFNVSGSDFIEMYVGVGAKRVRELFAEAKKNAPCIVFIDEIDAIGGKRGNSSNSEKDQTINAILTEMDGFAGNTGVMVMAATNRLDMLDTALTRPGRFDKHLAVPLPDKEDREAILKLHAKNKKLDETVDLKVLASQTTGFAGAGLESLLNEATLIAVNNGKSTVSQAEIDRAFFKVVMEGDIRDGQEKRGSKELELVAWHEAGHALITKLLTNDEVSKVTILSSTSGAGGVTFHNPKEGEFYSKQDLKNRIAISYGGRAAEEILFGTHDEVTVGASSDIQSASKAIKDYIMKYGMSDKFGMLDISAFDYQSMSNDDLIKEAAELANEVYGYTLKTLQENKDALERVALALLEKETLLDEEIVRLIENRQEEVKVEEVETTEEYVQMELQDLV